MNFFIYVLIGKRFREELLQILPCSRKPSEISADQPISEISCEQCWVISFDKTLNIVTYITSI